MKIPNYDTQEEESDFKQRNECMPDKFFRLLLIGGSGCGKTNTLLHMIYNLLYFDKIFVFSKNIQQSKYQNLIKTFEPINKEVGYDIIECYNDSKDIIPVSKLNDEGQKIIIFDDFLTDSSALKKITDYYVTSRHKRCCCIALFQSYFSIPKDLRLNATHMCIWNLNSNNEKSLVCRENSIPKDKYEKATSEPYSFLYLDKPKKQIMKNFNEKI